MSSMREGARTHDCRFNECEGIMATKSYQADGPAIVAESVETLVPVYVWELPVRIAHWVIFLSIAVLSFTGYYLYYPFIISRNSDAFLMGTMRFIHEIAGFALTAAFIVRMYWFFMGNRWAGWREFVPTSRAQQQDLFNQLRYYLFLRKEPALRLGHNPLAGFTYTIIYLLMFVEILSGLALFNHVLGSRVLGFFVNWVLWFASYRTLRQIYFLIMFAFLAFLVHHVYSAVLIDIEERSGLVGGIFSGYKFFTRRKINEDAHRK
jgi:Ni/Fe-hydrogenase 1 B-type cytochrome subunit